MPIIYVHRLGSLAGKGMILITNVTTAFIEARGLDGQVYRVVH